MAAPVREGDDVLGNLSQEESVKLLQLQDLTGIEDIQRCLRILTTHDWNIEAAVQDTFNEQEGVPSVFRDQRHDSSLPPVQDASNQSVVRASENMSWWRWWYSLFTFPLRFVYSTFADIIQFALGLLTNNNRQRIPTDPLLDVTSFIDDYEKSFGPRHPVFYRATYSQALNEAKRDLKFLLVYLHSEEHQDTERFCRETLADSSVIEYIDSNLLFWACSVKTAEGYRVSQALRETTYPFLALIVLRHTRMTVVCRVHGSVSANDLVPRLRQVTFDNEPALVVAREERNQRTMTQQIRAQQDEAYMDSLRQDQEKERHKRKAEEDKAAEEEDRRREREEHEQKQQDIAQMKSELLNQIPPEPPVDCAEDIIKVLLKLPAGGRIERRFKRNQSLKYLYFFVLCHNEAPDDFQIVTNFPRRELPCKPSQEVPEPPSFQEFGLSRAEMLFIHDNTA